MWCVLRVVWVVARPLLCSRTGEGIFLFSYVLKCFKIDKVTGIPFAPILQVVRHPVKRGAQLAGQAPQHSAPVDNRRTVIRLSNRTGDGGNGTFAGTYIFGIVNDKVGAKVGGFVMGIAGVAGFTILLMFNSSVFMVVVGILLFGIYNGCTSIILSPLAIACFGDRDYKNIFPVVAMISPWFGVVASPIWGFVYDLTGSYSGMLVAGVVASALTGIFTVLAISFGKRLSSKVKTEVVA